MYLNSCPNQGTQAKSMVLPIKTKDMTILTSSIARTHRIWHYPNRGGYPDHSVSICPASPRKMRLSLIILPSNTLRALAGWRTVFWTFVVPAIIIDMRMQTLMERTRKPRWCQQATSLVTLAFKGWGPASSDVCCRVPAIFFSSKEILNGTPNQKIPHKEKYSYSKRQSTSSSKLMIIHCAH